MKTAMMAVAEITSNDTANTSTAAEVGNGAGCREEGGGGVRQQRSLQIAKCRQMKRLKGSEEKGHKEKEEKKIWGRGKRDRWVHDISVEGNMGTWEEG
jgi:hypothetical protein